jgi:hypothetical protein
MGHNMNAIAHTQSVLLKPVLPYRGVLTEWKSSVESDGQERLEAEHRELCLETSPSIIVLKSGALFAARDELIDAGRNALAEAGDPQRRNDAGENIHSVVRTQN